MSNIFLMTLGICISLILALYFAWRYERGLRKNLSQKVEELKYNLQHAQKENLFLREGMKYLKETEEETNEKIDNLHNGDSVVNAISGLCKPRSRDR